MTTTRMTVDQLETMLDEEGNRYEIIDGELYVSHAPHLNHQRVASNLNILLGVWSKQSGEGEILQTPGLIFDPKNGVIPDLVWTSAARIGQVDDGEGKLRAAPDLVIEIVSPGLTNETRDKSNKLSLYAREGVREYWVVSYTSRWIEIYHPGKMPGTYIRAAILREKDTLTSPVLPGFSCPVSEVFASLR